MKTHSLAFLLLCSFTAFGQSETELTPPRALFKVSPQHFTINTLKIGAEVFNKNRTKSYSVFVYGRFDKDNSGSYSSESYRGLGGEFQYRKYLSPMKLYTSKRDKDYLRGVYAGAYLQGASYSNDLVYVDYMYNNNGQYTTTQFRTEESIGNWGAGFMIGVQRTFWEMIYVDVYAGGGIQWSDVINLSPNTPVRAGYFEDGSITSPGYQGIMPKFGLTLGVTL